MSMTHSTSAKRLSTRVFFLTRSLYSRFIKFCFKWGKKRYTIYL